jgi:hypothetical protein
MIDVTPFFPTFLQHIIDMEYSDLKETEEFGILLYAIDQEYQFKITIDGVIYIFNDVNDLFFLCRKICVECKNVNTEKYRYATLLNHAISKINIFLDGEKQTDQILDAFSRM